MRLVRRTAVAAVAALLLLAGVVLGLQVATRYGPAHFARLAEQALAERFGPIAVDGLHVTFDWGPAVEAVGVRTAPDPAAEGARVEAARVRIGFDLRQLWRGELRIGHVSVSGLRAEVVRDADGVFHPEAARRLVHEADARRVRAAAEADEREPGVRGALSALRDATAGLPEIAVDDAAVRWRDLAPGARLADVGVAGLAASLRRPRLGAALVLEASARLREHDEDRGGAELVAELPPLAAPHVDLALADVDLALARPWLAEWAPAREAQLALAGRLGAHLSWRAGEGDTDRVAAELVGLDLRASARPGPEQEEQSAALASGRASAVITIAPRAIGAHDVVVSLGPFRLEGDARFGRPLGERAGLAFGVRGAPLEAETIEGVLRASGRPAWRRAADAIESGHLSEWSLRCAETTRGDFRAFLAAPLTDWPAGCAFELTADGVGAKLGKGQPLRALRGRLVFGRDRLELHGVSGRLGDELLPTLDLKVTGVRAVAVALREGRLPAPVPPLPGWPTLDEWTKGDRPPGGPSRWSRADVELSRLEHPALLRPVAGVKAVLRPVPFGFDAEIADAWWGSARVSGRARKSGDPPGRIAVEAVARDDAGAPPVDRAEPAAWARGRFRVEMTYLGPFRASGVDGLVRVEGDRVLVTEGDAQLVPKGRLVGEVDLHLDRREYVPVEGRLRVEGGSLPDLLEDLALDREVMTGTLHASGDLSAKLIPHRNILRDMTGPVTGKLVDGEIRQRMNLLVAIAAASDTFNPFRSRDVLPYDELEGELSLERGKVRAEAVSLVGPAARLVGTGTVDVVDAPYPVEAVVGLFFFKTLDTVISKVPLVNRLLLGKDDNFWGAWFAVTGPWIDPEARVLPQTLLTSGPVGIVTEGLPGFVRSSLSTLQRLLGAQDEGAREAARRDEPRKEARP